MQLLSKFRIIKLKKLALAHDKKIIISQIAKLKIKSIKKLASNMINKQINARTRIKKLLLMCVGIMNHIKKKNS